MLHLPVRLGDWGGGDDNPLWVCILAHEACLAKSVFKTGGCPTCRRSFFLIDDEIVLARAAADGDTEKVRRLLENGIQHSPRGLFDTTPLLQAAFRIHGEQRRSHLET
jgi:hypothetical protein